MVPGERNDICIINCFFSPAGFRTPLVNFNTIVGKLLQTGAPMITVEAAFDNEPFQLVAQPGQTLIQLRAPARLWLKERLLNIALSHVPTSCNKVAWIDGDLIFERPDWLDEASNMLEQREVVQLFDTIHYLPPGTQEYQGISHRSHSSMLALVTEHGADALRRMQRGSVPYAVPGGGFAARRDVLQAGLYDGTVVGGNDNVFVYALLGALDLLTFATPALAQDIRRWELAFAAARTSFTHGYVKGTVYHLWHGEREHRGYITRHDLLRTYEFDPATDIALHENGCYRWNSPKPGLHEFTRQYFRARLEDGSATPAPDFPTPADLPREAREVISELYRRISESGDLVSRLQSERAAIEKELVNLRLHAQTTTEWAKDLKQGNTWLQSQLHHWQAHAQSLALPPDQCPARGRTPILLVVSPDRESTQMVLAALAPLSYLSFELTGSQGQAISFRGGFSESTEIAAADVVVLSLNYMEMATGELERLARRLQSLTLPTVWSVNPYPLDWYCRRTMEITHSQAAPFIDPVQFVATIEEQQRRSRLLRELLGMGRGVEIENSGKQLAPAATASLRQILELPVAADQVWDPVDRPLIQPQNLEAVLDYLHLIGANALREQVVVPESPDSMPAPR